MSKKAYLLILVLVVFVAAIILIANITQGEVLPLGSRLPDIQYRSSTTSHKLRADTGRPLLVMFFSRNCRHCIDELDKFNANVGRFSKTNLVFLTSDEGFEEDAMRNKWRILFDTTRKNIQLGSIREEMAKERFGVTGTPAFFAFEKNGVLVDRIFGEAKLDRLLGSANEIDSVQ
jgi:thioredoxin-related protein